MRTLNESCGAARETPYVMRLFHGHGHLEKVYDNALVRRLTTAGVEVKQQHPIQVLDQDGTDIGEHMADLRLDGRPVIEHKPAGSLADAHTSPSFLVTSSPPSSNMAC